MEALTNADAVCFDVDSTVIDKEGIDALTAMLGKGDEMARWTARVMGEERLGVMYFYSQTHLA